MLKMKVLKSAKMIFSQKQLQIENQSQAQFRHIRNPECIMWP